MATESSRLLISEEAGQDLSGNQYNFVTMSADGQVDPSTDGEAALGVLQNDPDAAGRAASICIAGKTKVVAGAAVTAGDAVASNASGRAITAASGDVILGVASEDASGDGSVISIVFQPRGSA